MFKSNYFWMFDETTKKLNQLNNSKNKELCQLPVTPIAILETVVEAAIEAYAQRGVSTDRTKDIQVIRLLFESFDDPEELRKKLELYFSGKSAAKLFKHLDSPPRGLQGLEKHTFITGFMDGSKLEDYVTAAFDSFHEHIIPSLGKNHIDELEEHLKYTKDNFYNFYCGKRPQDRPPGFDYEKAMRQSSDAIGRYPPGMRTVQTKTWNPIIQQEEGPEIIIALHGWRDSVECWNNLGTEASKRGYKVIAYDHRGYGFDAERKDLGHNNDLLSLDFRMFLASVMKTNSKAKIHLVGHSMGGAILLNNQNFIEKIPQIKSVTCFSPAVTPSIPSFLKELRHALFGREGHEEAIVRQQHNQPRFVTAELRHPQNLLKIITTLPKLFLMMIQAHQSLRSLVQKKNTKPWAILYGKRDRAVSPSSFEQIKSECPKDALVSFFGFPRGDHLLSQGRNSSVVLDKFFKIIKHPIEINQPSCLPINIS